MALKIKGDTTKVVKLPTAAPGSGKGFKLRNSTAAGGGGGGVSAASLIIPGLEQSHWDVANANFSGAYVLSIPDVNGSNITMTAEDSGWLFPYEASGWSLNGKTLPSMRPRGSGIQTKYRANGWATKLQGYTGAFTVVTLVDIATYNSMSQRTFSIDSNGWPFHNGYGRDTSYGLWDIDRNVSAGDAIAKNTAGFFGKQIIIEEYTGTAAATVLGQFRLWINGNEQTLSMHYASTGNAGKAAMPALQNFYTMPGWGDSVSSKWNQFHIYKGSLTDQQRNDITAYLKSISGIA